MLLRCASPKALPLHTINAAWQDLPCPRIVHRTRASSPSLAGAAHETFHTSPPLQDLLGTTLQQDDTIHTPWALVRHQQHPQIFRLARTGSLRPDRTTAEHLPPLHLELYPRLPPGQGKLQLPTRALNHCHHRHHRRHGHRRGCALAGQVGEFFFGAACCAIVVHCTAEGPSGADHGSSSDVPATELKGWVSATAGDRGRR